MKSLWGKNKSPNLSSHSVNYGQQAPAPTQQPPSQQQDPAEIAPGEYREHHPQRATSTSHRQSAHLLGQPSPDFQQHPGPQASPALSQNRQSYQQPQPSPTTFSPEPKKQSLRSRIAAGVKGHKDAEAAKQAQKNGIGRAQSVRKSDLRPQEYQSQEHSRLQASQQWHQRQSSSPNLATSSEQDEDNLDPFLQQDNNETPQVPPKDYQQNVRHPQNPQQQHSQPQHQQFAQNPHQEQYNRPPLGRVSTEGSYQAQGGVDHYSPDQSQGPPQQTSQQQQYSTYQPPVQHPPSAKEYQAFNPQNAPSPVLVPVQLHGQGQGQDPGQDPSQQQQQQQYYQYQHQQLSQQAPGQQSLDNSPQSAHYPQQQQLPPQSQPQPQPRQAQDPQLQQPQSQNQQPQSAEPRAPNTTPLQQGQDNMAPGGQGAGRNTLRKVNDSSQQPGAPSRESSLQQPPAQASQGQPYRGDKGQQPQQNNDMGRATPPPRGSTSDMTSDEIEKLQKEHEVLREKYQKVKRYFFEQQTQVHQLQNTIANQRLSQSRTSWDDSEYATRFNRLDGLIAQLSFSIRKDWKTIPQWLQIVVNKTAVETGKQEMTAVGRAFISHWLVENIFDKYFHPDLEPGFSTQLQTIAINIRKFSPPCHSAEDEESLAAKIINWRLATLEGLVETLRSPSATTYRQNLTDTLNEKLIGSLQMHLNDPAPPDLNGGVPMIVELAVSIAQHLPLESREVHIEYFPPGHGIVSDFMKLESGIPALTAPIRELEEADRASLRSVTSKAEDSSSIMEQEQQLQSQNAPKEEKKRGVFSFGGSKKPNPANLNKRESSLGQGGSQLSLTNPPGSSHGPKDEPPPPRVRLAVGVAVQIRGKSILMKAPVYST
ncbi:hypothetical protein ACN47E_004056 [Coniothyrium glycines]